MQFDGRRECGAQFANARPEQTPVIGIERGLADASGKAVERHATDQQLTVGDGKLVHRGVNGKRSVR